MMEYKGYYGVASVDDEAGIIHGEVVNTRAVITFQGSSLPEVREAFEDSVEDYLEFCAVRGKAPEKPYSGRFNVRIEPDLHRTLALIAASSEKSMNDLVKEALAELAGEGEGRAVPKKAAVPSAKKAAKLERKAPKAVKKVAPSVKAAKKVAAPSVKTAKKANSGHARRRKTQSA